MKNEDNFEKCEVEDEEKRYVGELTPSELLSFSWQIASGMVRKMSLSMHGRNILHIT